MAGTSPSFTLDTAVRRVTGLPVVALRLWLRGGARVEELPGQAYITGRMLCEGTRQRSWKEIAEAAESRGMILSSSGTLQAQGLALDALAQDWEEALDWVFELLLESSFPEERSDWLTRQAAAELESLADRPEVKTRWAFLKQLYTPHPANRPLSGDATSLARLQGRQCAAFHRRVTAVGGVFTVAGEVDEDRVRSRVETLLEAFNGDADPLSEPPSPVGLEELHQTLTTNAQGQAHLYAGHLMVSRTHPDLTALELIGVILGSGSGLTGRIPTRIREQEGLAYSAHATTTAGCGVDAGHLLVYVGTSPDTVAQAERGIREELTRLLDEGIQPGEFEEARSYLLGREPFRRETARQWADLLAEARFFRLPIDEPEYRREQVEALELTEVQDVARRHIFPEKLKVTVGLPSAEG